MSKLPNPKSNFGKLKNLKNLQAFLFSICGKRKLMILGIKPKKITKLSQNKYYSISRPEDKSIKIVRGVRMLIRGFVSRAYLKKALALATIIAVIGMTYWQNTPQVSAATVIPLEILLAGLAIIFLLKPEIIPEESQNHRKFLTGLPCIRRRHIGDKM